MRIGFVILYLSCMFINYSFAYNEDYTYNCPSVTDRSLKISNHRVIGIGSFEDNLSQNIAEQITYYSLQITFQNIPQDLYNFYYRNGVDYDMQTGKIICYYESIQNSFDPFVLTTNAISTNLNVVRKTRLNIGLNRN